MRVMELGVRWSSIMKIGMHCSQMMCYEGAWAAALAAFNSYVKGAHVKAASTGCACLTEAFALFHLACLWRTACENRMPRRWQRLGFWRKGHCLYVTYLVDFSFQERDQAPSLLCN